ncbi:protein transport protein gos1 [Ophidiomyces ophidiicola]|uniref:Protein transport protein gos1 n=1 Tax=Ophidiomyces ophidiicola TaxID=1387563 RepID=A0ACB8UM44_9EURO|nr:protein transport protein gos1 [Ophidiomyces ophidiicola]KAI1905533.1 protein transport protein gos1 [Ophidiomyces ophidiicola]KAI1905938.1 protein transport protein gos1 [Ophidiomyces ophidiicola]KAI1919292.1 protein transport protein gos1 [Ophidiomyces ophidiicola]KAI1930437.1 protein transport protein gos1 [Ophidiomyces ophidiicola]KAI1934903.1 protein transport protein gos1 [Ophidiomyces ophidiicola]
MTSSSGIGWAQLRQQARSLEAQTESLFHVFSQFASVPEIPTTPSAEERRVETQLEELLNLVWHIPGRQLSLGEITDSDAKRQSLISQLSRLLDSESSLPASALKRNNLARHRAILHDHQQELRRLQNSISESRARQNLLSNIRSDINAHHLSDSGIAEADYMLEERGRIDNSNSAMDSILSQAYAVNDNFTLQRETLTSIRHRVMAAANQVPGVNSLISRIGAKRRRDSFTMGIFIGACFLIFLYYR